MRKTGQLAVAGALLLGTAACGQPGPDQAGGKIAIVAGFYPLQFAAERVGGDRVAVRNLAKPGAEPHDLELQPGQVRQIADADLVVYLKGFQPAVDETVAQNAGDRALDAAQPMRAAGPGNGSGAPGGNDPHLWLDPDRVAALGDRLAERLGRIDSDHADDYRGRAAALRAELGTLSAEYTAALRGCQRREIITSHAAFGYLAQRFGLTQIAISGLTPETEPSPAQLAAVAEQARRFQATTIFFETLVSPEVAEAVAREVGARTAVLDPIEGLPPGSSADYLSVMRSNLASLTSALGCP